MSIVYKGGTLVADEVWTAGTYVLTSQVVVLNFDLTFDTTLGDVVVKLNNYNISMQGAGSVTCIGSHRVILTSVNDNSVGEVVPGSTGMPERTDNTIAMFIVQPAAVSDLMLRHVDFRYCYNTHGAFVLFGSNLTTLTIQDVSLRNCTVTAANRCLFGHYADFTSSIATVSVQDLNIDRSNYVITTSASVVSFVGQHTNFTARGIFIEGNSSFPCAALFRLGLQPGIVQSPLLENILLVGVPTSGPHLQIIELNAAPFLGTKTVDIKYALFLGTANASNGGLVFTELYSASATINLQNSIFSGFTAPGNGSDFAIKRAVAVTLNENNNGFYNNYANILIDGGGSQVLDATDITTDPDISTLPPEIVVDEACPFPDGYSVRALTEYEEQGSETFDASGFDEAVYTGTGRRYAGGDYTTPGIMYLVDPVPQAEILGAPVFVREPNWLYAVELSYLFTTAISLNRRAVEQRRSLHDIALRSMMFVVSGFENKIEFENFLDRYRNGYINIPVFSEPLTPTNTGLLTGLNLISLREQCADRTNLTDFADYVILVDIRGQVDAEMLPLDLSIGQQLLLGGVIAGAFLGECTVVYPAMYAMIESFRVDDVTDKIGNVELTVREVR